MQEDHVSVARPSYSVPSLDIVGGHNPFHTTHRPQTLHQPKIPVNELLPRAGYKLEIELFD